MSRCGSVGWTVSSLSTTLPRFHSSRNPDDPGWDAALADVRSAESSLSGRLRVNVPVVFGRRFVVPVVAELLTRHPRLAVDLVFDDRYVNPVDQGFDVVVRIGVPVDSSLTSHSLGQSTRTLAAAPSYIAAHGKPKAPRDLARHQCLVHTELGASAVWSFKKSGKSHRASVRGRISADNSEATLALARAGHGICLLASWLLQDDVRDGTLVPLLSGYAPPLAPIRALTPPGRQVPPRVRTFIQALREVTAADRQQKTALM